MLDDGVVLLGFIFLQVVALGEAQDAGNQGGGEHVKVPFNTKDLNVYCNESQGGFNWFLKGFFKKPGIYTNIWLNIDKIGRTNETLCYFIVRNSSTKKEALSCYDVKNSCVVHKLFKNVSFSFKEKSFFESLYKKEGLDWFKIDSKEIDPPLPDGLKAEATDDGDWQINGFPTVSGIFTNTFNRKSLMVTPLLFYD